MSPICYLRVFDLDKYREIEPVIRKIYDKNADPSQVASLLQEAIDITKSDEFKQYNGTDSGLEKRYIYYLESTLNLVKSGYLLEWLNSDINTSGQDNTDYSMPYFIENITYENYLLERVSSNKIDIKSPDFENIISCDRIIDIVTLLLCCPKYQNSTENNKISFSDFTIEYTNVYGILYIFNENICNLLERGSPEYSVENIPFDGDMVILKPELLSVLTDIASKDMSNLSQLGHILYLIRDNIGTPYRYDLLPESNNPTNLDDGDSFTREPHMHGELIDFYRSLCSMLKLISTQSSYVVLNEVLF